MGWLPQRERYVGDLVRGATGDVEDCPFLRAVAPPRLVDQDAEPPFRWVGVVWHASCREESAAVGVFEYSTVLTNEVQAHPGGAFVVVSLLGEVS